MVWVVKYEEFETDAEEIGELADNVEKVYNLTTFAESREEAGDIYEEVIREVFELFPAEAISDSSHEHEESIFVDLPHFSFHVEYKEACYSDDKSNVVSKEEFVEVAKKRIREVYNQRLPKGLYRG